MKGDRRKNFFKIFILITIVVSFFLFVDYIVGRFGTTFVVFFFFRSISMGLEKLGVSAILKNSILWSLKLKFIYKARVFYQKMKAALKLFKESPFMVLLLNLFFFSIKLCYNIYKLSHARSR